MSVVAAAVIGSTIVGGVAANSAASKSASAAKSGIAESNALAQQARTDAINLFSRGLQSSTSGINSALNFYQDNAQGKAAPFIAGNVAAQKILGQGATQANNAILGLPVDMSFANNPTALAADYSGIKNAKLPVLGGVLDREAAGITGQSLSEDPTGLKTLLGASAVSPPVGSKGQDLSSLFGKAAGVVGKNLVNQIGGK